MLRFLQAERIRRAVDALNTACAEGTVRILKSRKPNAERTRPLRITGTTAPSSGRETTADPTATPVFVVRAVWDEEAGVWVAASDDVPGLVTEAATLEALDTKVKALTPELLEANGPMPLDYVVKIEIR